MMSISRQMDLSAADLSILKSIIQMIMYYSMIATQKDILKALLSGNSSRILLQSRFCHWNPIISK